MPLKRSRWPALLAALTRWPALLAALTFCTAALAELPPRVRQALQQAQVPPSAMAVLVAPADTPTLQIGRAHV